MCLLFQNTKKHQETEFHANNKKHDRKIMNLWYFLLNLWDRTSTFAVLRKVLEISFLTKYNKTLIVQSNF